MVRENWETQGSQLGTSSDSGRQSRNGAATTAGPLLSDVINVVYMVQVSGDPL